jgi:hypothetical protein
MEPLKGFYKDAGEIYGDAAWEMLEKAVNSIGSTIKRLKELMLKNNIIIYTAPAIHIPARST